MRKVIAVVMIVVILGALGYAAYWYTHRETDAGGRFRTGTVTRGDIISTITATGTVEPEEVVDVGAQVTGQILSFGLDADGKPIDYNSVVKEKQILANIDPALYQSDRDSAQAALLQARANVERCKADLVQKQALLNQAKNDWERAQALWNTKSGALAQSAYDQYKANFEVAKANVDIDAANIQVAEATVTQCQAALDKCQRNLDYCTIYSPVDGTVIDRRVNTGQTVVSSLSTSSLFLIAKDLKRMQIWVSVNEADVGSVFDNQPVKFTVNARPGEIFDGTVGRVRKNATMSQNVVTYTVEVNTDNSSGKLMPYLTADAFFETGHREKVLMVPNAALRWTPTAAQMDPLARSADAGKSGGKAASAGDSPAAVAGTAADAQPATAGTAADAQPATAGTAGEGRTAKAGSGGHGGRGGSHGDKPSGSHQKNAKIWVQDGAYVRAIPVTAGLTDGINTEISGEGVDEGLEIITGDVTAGSHQGQGAANSGQSSSPFMPQMPTRPRGR